MPSRHRRLRAIEVVGFVGWATAIPKLTCRADRHIERFVSRTASVLVRVHPDWTAVVIGSSRGYAQLSRIVAARSSDRPTAKAARRMGCEVAAAVGRAPGAERTAGVVATEDVAVARLVLASPVAAVLPGRAALVDAALVARLVATFSAAPRLAGPVAAQLILLAALSRGARATRRSKRTTE